MRGLNQVPGWELAVCRDLDLERIEKITRPCLGVKVSRQIDGHLYSNIHAMVIVL
jgi:hypothetical protein